MGKRIYLKRATLLFLFTVITLVYFLVTTNPSHYFFLNDDFVHIPLVSKNDFLHGVFYRPLSNFSLWIDYKIWGRNAFGYHLTNVLIHLSDTVLIYFLGVVIFPLSGVQKFIHLKSLLSAILFLVYSYHSEPIFWIIGRGGSLATLFFLLALVFYLKSWSGNRMQFVSSLFFFGVGLFAYELIWIFPPVTIIFIVIFKPVQGQTWKLWAIVIMFASFLLLRVLTIKTAFTDYELGALKGGHFGSLVYNYNLLLARCFLPPMKSSALFLLSYGLLVSGLVVVLFRFWKNRVLFTCFCCLAVSVLPVVQLGVDTHDSESERLLYLATVFAVYFLIELLFEFDKLIVEIGFVVLVLFHVARFSMAADSYKFSSMVARRSLECIDVGAASKIIAINVPTQYKGALIFRTGLPEALQWFRGVDPNKVDVRSQIEILHKFPRLHCAGLYRTNKDPATNSRVNSGFKATSKRSGNAFIRWNRDSLYATIK